MKIIESLSPFIKGYLMFGAVVTVITIIFIIILFIFIARNIMKHQREFDKEWNKHRR